MVILFFPLLSFFTKGVSLCDLYLEKHFINLILKIIKNNLAFIIFLFIGPTIVIIHKIVIKIKKHNASVIGGNKG
jgi:hypothetical protein